MKSKLIGLLICIMLLTILFAAAKPATKIELNPSSKTQTTSSIMVDVPIWEIGNTWTYQVNDLSINYTTETQSVLLYGSITELPLEVTNTTGDFYTLSFATTMNGIGYITANPSEGPVNVSVTFSDLAIQGTLQVEKSTLGIKNIAFSFDNQKIAFNMINQPYITLPDWLHTISAKFTSNIDIHSDISVALLSFPLFTGMYWDLLATNISVNGKLQSFLFNVLHFLNNFAKLFGLDFLPVEIAELLPIIDFNQALTNYLGTNVFQVPGFAGLFFCPATESISVPAGTYDAYNISLMGGIGQCYYAPDAGNVIQLKGNFQDIIPFVQSIDLVLLSTTYN
ncbi:MAG: hypothetical protein NTX92_08190 [Euryarchaeota archaeon]|nr:hypothetical protein [Euryarchaeota archaeon]